MGIWEFINSTTETVKTNSPDLTPLKDACKASYGYGSAAFWKIDNVVRVNGLQKLNDHVRDEKGRAQIALFASKFAQNAANYAFKETYKIIPGGETVGKIVSKTVRDMQYEDRNNQKMEEAAKEAIVTVGKTSSSRNVLDRAKMQSKGVQFGYEKGISADSRANQTPEDVLRIFMMKEFMGSRFFDDLIIPQKRSHGKEEPK